MEHAARYPIDTVKTRMQAALVNSERTPPRAVQVVREVVGNVLCEQGANCFIRGSFAIGAGCIPAHNGLFCTYEYARGSSWSWNTTSISQSTQLPVVPCPTVVHDFINTHGRGKAAPATWA